MKTPWKNRLKSNRPRPKDDFYETPIELCEAAFTRFFEDEGRECISWWDVLDAGAGNGIWGKGLFHLKAKQSLNFSRIWGIELQDLKLPPAFYDVWYPNKNYLELTSRDKFKFIFGNPPYSLAEKFIRKSFDLLADGGYVYFLLRLAFLESMNRGNGLFKNFPPKRVYVSMRRPSFFSTNGRRTTDALSYAMFLWQKGYNGKTELAWLDWNYEN